MLVLCFPAHLIGYGGMGYEYIKGRFKMNHSTQDFRSTVCMYCTLRMYVLVLVYTSVRRAVPTGTFQFLD